MSRVIPVATAKHGRWKTTLGLVIFLVTLLVSGDVAKPIWNLIAQWNSYVTPTSVSAIVFLTLFFAILYRTPAEMHKEQVDEVKRLRSNYEGDVVVPNLAIDPFPDHALNDSLRITGVGIRIENHSPLDITDASVELDRLTWHTEIGDDIQIVIAESNRIFPQWSYPNIAGTIAGKNKALVQIAMIQNDEIMFLVKDPYVEHRTEQVAVRMGHEERAAYTASLWIKGKMNGRPIHDQKFELSFRFVRVKSKWVFDEKGWHEVAEYQTFTSFLIIGEPRDRLVIPQPVAQSHIIYVIGGVKDEKGTDQKAETT